MSGVTGGMSRPEAFQAAKAGTIVAPISGQTILPRLPDGAFSATKKVGKSKC